MYVCLVSQRMDAGADAGAEGEGTRGIGGGIHFIRNHDG